MNEGFLDVEGFGPEPAEGALVFGPSTLNDWLLCNYRVLFKNHPLHDNRSNEPPAFGTGMHALIEGTLRDGVAVYTPEEALEVWKTAMLENHYGAEDITEYAPENVLIQKAHELVRGHSSWVEKFWLPVGQHMDALIIEQRIERPLGRIRKEINDTQVDREVWISGAADFVATHPSGTGALGMDWKTAGRGWKRGKADSNTQHIIYGWLAEVLLDIPVVEGMYVVYNRQKEEWTWDDKRIILTPQMRQAALKMAWDAAVGMDAQIGVASPMTRGGFGDGRGWHCKPQYCPAWNACGFRHMIEDDWAQKEKPEEMRWE